MTTGPGEATAWGRTGADAEVADLPAPGPATAGHGAAAGLPGAGPLEGHRSRAPSAALVAALTAAVVLPLVVALVALRSPRWFPLLDLAMTEMRVRDVGGRHTPLVGLVGRLAWDGHQGSHPGPLSFWSLAPTYRLLGGSAWSMLVGVVALNTAAVALTVWAAWRRGGAVVALGFAAGLAVLVHLYGTKVLTEPWNPYMPVLWWTLTLVALWAVLCDDLTLLPVAVFAASFCAQTHISYVGLVGGLAGLAVAVLAVRWARLREDAPARRRLVGWAAVAAALSVVLWLPPLIDQVTGDPGNASIVVGYFQDPGEEPIGVGRGTELLAVQLNPWRLAAGQPATSGSVVPGLALVAVWAAATVLAWRLPQAVAARSSVLRLHVVVGAALVLGFVSASRVLGFVWFYLTLWAWSIALLMVLATVWTAALALPGVVAAARSPGHRRRLGRPAVAVLATVLVGWTGWFVAEARRAEPTQAVYSSLLGRFTSATTAAIDAGEVGGGGPDGHYLVTWTDGVNMGSTGYGLVNELERAGYHAGVSAPFAPGAGEHRVMEPEVATAEIHVSFGPDIAAWEARPDVALVVRVDPRTPRQRAEYRAARTEVVDGLRAAGRDELVPVVDRAPFQLYFDEDLPDDLRRAVQVITDTGQPAAVFVGPRPRRPGDAAAGAAAGAGPLPTGAPGAPVVAAGGVG